MPIYIQEKIHPRTIIEDLKRESAGRARTPNAPEQMDFFSDFNGVPKGVNKMDFYHYEDEEHEGWFYPLVYEHFDVEYNHPLQAEVDHFIDLCQGRETVPRCTGEDGMRTLKIVNAIIESGDTGQVVTIA